MNSLIKQFFAVGEEEAFQEVIFLDGNSISSWEDLSKKAPDLPRGWYELSRVSSRYRVEFTRDYWLDRLPYHPSAHPLFFEFFEQLDDVLVVLTRKRKDELMSVELIYSLADSSSFFRGRPPCKEGDLEELTSELAVVLPRDYLSFLRIHNGFGKLSEMGLLSFDEIPEARRRIVDLVMHSDSCLKSGSKVVDPGSLIPFYEALGLGSFQCFYADWYPESEMGNVYLSGIDYTLSDVKDKKEWLENLAFSTFMEWLTYYLQGMDVSP